MIGVAISTVPSRRQLFSETYIKWEKMMPQNAILTYVSDDCKAGIAKNKNTCLKVLESLGVTEYFLSDDDTWPISEDWWKPFVDSPEPHMLYNFRLPRRSKLDMRVEYSDDKIISYSHTRGCLIYVNQKVLDTVGGFDERFYNGYEHPDYTNRIHNAGLTSFRSMSPVGVEKLFYCLDQDGAVESSIRNTNLNYKLYRANRNSKEYKDYK